MFCVYLRYAQSVLKKGAQASLSRHPTPTLRANIKRFLHNI